MTLPLPVVAFLPTILAAVAAEPALLVEADTGAGKSTRIARALVEAGYRVLVTEPRRMAARTLATFVAAEMGVPLGGLVGYRVGRAAPMDSAETRLLFATDALALVRELMGDGGGYDVLVIDEVHEFGLAAEVLLAWARREQGRGARFKLVLLSATVDTAPLAAYLGTPERPAPVIAVPGRVHPIEDRAPARRGIDLETTIAAMADAIGVLVAEGRSVLAFVPGKGEIEDLTAMIADCGAEILPLHGGLTEEEQARCFAPVTGPRVIVATNVAQTSITVEGIDAVVDSGYERRVETRGGVEGIYLGLIARASAAQRRGRAGRTRPGIYVDCAPPGPRTLYAVPEIQRVLLDQAVLRLAHAGLDAATLPFMHQPAPAEIAQAKRTLFHLGAMTASGAVTARGATIARLPVSVRAGRSLVEAAARGGRALLDAVVLAAALADVGTLGSGRPLWRRHTGRIVGSDVLAQIHAFHASAALETEEALEAAGFLARKVQEARSQYLEIGESAREVFGDGANSDQTLNPADVVRCVAAGLVDQLRARHYTDRGWPAFGVDERRIGRESVVDAGPRQDREAYDDQWGGEWEGPKSGAAAPPLWVVGIPFDIGGRGGSTMRVLRHVSLVDPEQMVDLAPEHVTRTLVHGSFAYDPPCDAVLALEQTSLYGAVVAERRVAVEDRRAGHHLRIYLAQVLTGRVKIAEKVRATHLVVLRELVVARARAEAVNLRLGEARWPQPSVEALVAQIGDDATGLGPLIAGMAAPAPTVEEEAATPSPKGDTRRARRGMAQG